MQATACLSGEKILRFHGGMLKPEEQILAANHLDECEACRLACAVLGFPFPPKPPTNQEPLTAHGADDTLPDPPQTPERIGPYRILRLIGRGGMGAVYEARHVKLDRVVALKILTGSMKIDREFQERFDREARVIAKLDHPNIVRATDAGELDGYPFLALELLDGVDVARLGQAIGRLPVSDAVEIGFQTALGLAHLHERDVIHRDIKPSNLMLSTDGIVKILDLGLVLTSEAAGRPTGRLTGITFLGTHDYMAPEQWLDPTSVTAKVDVYGLGCVLYQMLGGHAPFAAQRLSPQAKMKAHLEQAVPPLTDRNDIPQSLVDLIHRMLAKPAPDRPSACDVAEELALLRAPNHLARLLEQSRLAPVTGFTDGDPTNEAPQPLEESSLILNPTTRLIVRPTPIPVHRGTPTRWFIYGLITTLAFAVAVAGAALRFGFKV